MNPKRALSTLKTHTDRINTLKASINWSSVRRLGLAVLGAIIFAWLLLVILSTLAHLCVTLFGEWIASLLMLPVFFLTAAIIKVYVVPLLAKVTMSRAKH